MCPLLKHTLILQSFVFVNRTIIQHWFEDSHKLTCSVKTKQRSDSIALGQAAIESNFGIELGVMGKVELGY